MKSRALIVLLWVCILTACSSATPNAVTEPLSVQDKESFVKALQAAGASVESGDALIQEFFTPQSQGLKVNGSDLQVFQYQTAEEMEKEAAQVAPDGGSVGTSMMTWIDTPHFYKIGRIIVLYLGNDQAMLDLLNKVIGPQFAGQ